MPEGTELIPVQEGAIYTRSDIEKALEKHMELRLDRFDKNGVEQSPLPGRSPMKLRLLHQSPPVLAIDSFFTPEECQQVMDVTKAPDNDSALQVDSATFTLAVSKRTSTSWFCYYHQMPTLLAKVYHVLGIPYEQMEEPQIVRYRTGEEFSWHYDEVPPQQLDNGGQRLVTLLVYLNTVQRGGGTTFRDLLQGPDGHPLTMKPVQGSALLFFPAYRDGRPDDRTLHKGEVASDNKWIVQMWIHEKAYSAVVPPGNSHEAAQDAVDKVSRELGYL
jgi:prolyl 4-hydroxylase